LVVVIMVAFPCVSDDARVNFVAFPLRGAVFLLVGKT
jgi:hypothetical protein